MDHWLMIRKIPSDNEGHSIYMKSSKKVLDHHHLLGELDEFTQIQMNEGHKSGELTLLKPSSMVRSIRYNSPRLINGISPYEGLNYIGLTYFGDIK